MHPPFKGHTFVPVDYLQLLSVNPFISLFDFYLGLRSAFPSLSLNYWSINKRKKCASPNSQSSSGLSLLKARRSPKGLHFRCRNRLHVVDVVGYPKEETRSYRPTAMGMLDDPIIFASNAKATKSARCSKTISQRVGSVGMMAVGFIHATPSVIAGLYVGKIVPEGNLLVQVTDSGLARLGPVTTSRSERMG